MSDLTGVARSILNVAKKVTPLIPGTLDDAAVAGVQAVVNLIDRFQEVSSASAEELTQVRAELEARVPANLRAEADRLRGG